MTKQNNKNSLRLVSILETWALFSMLALAPSLAAQGNAAQPWTAPVSDSDMKNPVAPTAQNVAAGKTVYEDNCLMCHGEKGAGDGVAGRGLPVKPADFTNAKLMKSETDGSLFWKMTTGRGSMPGWKDTLSDTQRWQLVNYIRTLAKGGEGEKSTAPGHDEH
jgi:mono/diheme cytochrome c family protein